MNAPDQPVAAYLPTASVVTTVFNRERSLSRAMRSVLEQSSADFEYIVIDDGSTDASAAIAEATGDPRVTVVRMPHRGRAAALNTAFDLCRGEFILIQDSDDVALPERFAKQIAFLRQHPEVGMVGCRLTVTDVIHDTTKTLRLPATHEEIRFLMPVTSAVAFCCSCIRRSILLSPRPFDETMTAAEDFDFQLNHLSRTRFHNLEDILQQKFSQIDSMGNVQELTQDRLTRERSLRFLMHEELERQVFTDLREIQFHRARVEYYYGDIRAARGQLFSLILRAPLNIGLYRFFLPSLLGSRCLSALRKRGLTTRTTHPLRRISFLRKQVLP